MIRGWRNDPRWVELYERKQKERIAREISRIQFEQQMKQNAADLEYRMNALRKPGVKLV